MNKVLMVIAGIIVLTGCSSKYKSVEVTKSTELLIKSKPVVISGSADGSYEGKPYSGSGEATEQAVRSAFSRYTDNAVIVSQCNELVCLQKHNPLSEGYYVVPQILHWEDRATEWSGIPDKIEVKVTVFNAATSKVIASTILNGSSKWATFGGDHPQDLLPEPVNNYVASLY